MEKYYSLTSFKHKGNSDRKMMKKGDLILINRKNYNNENVKMIKNKSFTNPVKSNILVNKQKEIVDNKKKNIKYYLSETQKNENINGNNIRDNIILTKSQRVFNFFLKKKNDIDQNKNQKSKYRYPISNNSYNIFNNNNDKENNKILVNKSNEYISIIRKSHKSNLVNLQKVLYINENYQNFLKTQKIEICGDKKIFAKKNFETNKTPKNETPIVKIRPHSIKYNHIRNPKRYKKNK